MLIIPQTLVLVNNYRSYLDILSTMPISHKVISKLDPPYERNGNVTPVTGINPTTTIKFNTVWKAIWNVIPNAKYLPKRSLLFLAILNPVNMIVKKKTDTIIIPKKPNSSLIIEKIKSVWGSGR